MTERIEMVHFQSECGQTSTPKAKLERQSRVREFMGPNQTSKRPGKEFVAQLLNSRDNWPVQFRTACQEHLNELQLSLDRTFLVKMESREKARRLSPIMSGRSRSRARERSMSPCGARRMKESKWESRAELAVLLVEEILRRSEDWPATLLAHSQSDFEAKLMLEALSRTATKEQRATKIRERPVGVAGQALCVVLRKMGVLLPAVISQQLGLLHGLITRSNGHLARSRTHIEAVQTLLLNVPTASRHLLQKLLQFFKVVSESRSVSINELQLAAVLTASLFEGRDGGNQLGLCRDLIVLSEKLFEAPAGLLCRLQDALSARRDVRTLDLLLKPRKAPGPPQSYLPSYFCHTKAVIKPDAIVLTAVNKISSPDSLKMAKPAPTQSASKRKSFTEIKKKILEKSTRPFRKSREYVINDFCAHKAF